MNLQMTKHFKTTTYHIIISEQLLVLIQYIFEILNNAFKNTFMEFNFLITITMYLFNCII